MNQKNKKNKYKKIFKVILLKGKDYKHIQKNYKNKKSLINSI